MFDFIKFVLGKPTCWGCVHRRMWGLFCGCKTNGVFPHRAWHGNAIWCWHYTDTRPKGETDGR